MNVKYKYNFWRVLGEQYPGPENLQYIQGKLQEEAALTPDQLNEYLNIRQHEPKDVPASFLLVFAVRLGVDVKELINYNLPRNTFANEAMQAPKSLQKLGAVIRK